MIKTETVSQFHTKELAPALKEVRGPVTSFEISKLAAERAKKQAVEMGNLIGITFVDCPVFDDVDQRKLHQEAKRAMEIAKLISTREGEPTVFDEAALMHAEGELASATIVEGARLIHEGADEATSSLYKSEIARAQDILYGPLDHELAHSSIAAWWRSLENAPEDQRNRFRESYPWITDMQGELPHLSSEKVEAYHHYLHETFDPYFDQLREEFPEVNNDNLVEATNRYLELRHLRDERTKEGWKCEEAGSRSGFQVAAGTQTLRSGPRSVPLTWSRFQELMLHEVEIHVMRGHNARAKGADVLASPALPGVAMIEEGLGILIEDLWKGKISSPMGRDVFRLAAVAYADGAYDHKKHTEDETFQFVKDMMALYSASEKSIPFEQAEKKVRASAYDHTFRAYRGMPEGEVLRRNASYLSGRKKAINLIENTDLPPEVVIPFLQQAKTDPTNPAHGKTMKAYGMTTLEELYGRTA